MDLLFNSSFFTISGQWKFAAKLPATNFPMVKLPRAHHNMLIYSDIHTKSYTVSLTIELQKAASQHLLVCNTQLDNCSIPIL